jgi:uncharacterized membrane protein YhaH (DUF805 family)
MNFQDAIKSGFKNYANFSGRAVRSEFWYWILFCFIVGIVTAILDGAIFPDNDISPLNTIFGLAVLIPNFAVGARRLHDIDRTGWWQLIAFTVIGIFILIYWWVQPGQQGTNRFGGPAPTTA